MTNEKLSPREEEKRIAAENGFKIGGVKSDQWARHYFKGDWYMWRCGWDWQTAMLDRSLHEGVGGYRNHKMFKGDDAMKKAMDRINAELVVARTWGE